MSEGRGYWGFEWECTVCGGMLGLGVGGWGLGFDDFGIGGDHGDVMFWGIRGM